MDSSNKVLFVNYASDAYLPMAKVSRNSFFRHATSPATFQLEHVTEETPWLKEPVVTQANLARSRPEFFKHLFNTTDVLTIVYFGADMYFMKDVTYVQQLPGIALCTPHLVNSYPPTASAAAWGRMTGLLNSDFMILRRDPRVFEFLDWWSEMLDQKNSGDVLQGYFWDQGYMQQLLQFEWFTPLCDPRLNVAFYNLHERDLSKTVAFQFTGYEPKYPTKLSKYAILKPQLKTKELTDLMLNYHNELMECGWKSP
jgi:hypothetical protein